MASLVNVDGEIVAPGAARVSAFDRGFLYGDSVYETLRTYGGRCFRLAAHLERLERSASAIGIVLPGGRERIAREVERTVGEAGNAESAVRIVVSRGEGPIGLDPGPCTSPSLVVYVRPLVPLAPEVYERGVRVIVARTLRNSPRALDPDVKSGNFLNNIQAAREAIAAGAFEAVLLGAGASVAEGAQSNLFLVRDGTVVTPAPGAGLLRGLTRELVLALCRDAGIPHEEREVFVAELYDADELFLTSTLKEVVPVTAIGRRPVGDGAPGPVTRRLAALYRTRAAGPGEALVTTSLS